LHLGTIAPASHIVLYRARAHQSTPDIGRGYMTSDPGSPTRAGVVFLSKR
jgi:hypothetical protein